MEQRLRVLEGELAQQAEEIRARIDRSELVDPQVQATHARLREDYWSIKRRWQELRAQAPSSPAGPDEF